MSNEKLEKIRKYKAELEKELEELNAERNTLFDKVKNGEILSKKEAKRNQELVPMIKDIEEKLESFKSLDLLDNMKSSLTSLAQSKTTKAEKEKIIKKLLSQFKKINKTIEEDMKNQSDLTDKDLRDLSKVKSDINAELSELKVELRIAKRKDYETSDIEAEIEDKEYILELIENYENDLLNITEVESDLNKLANSSTPKALQTIIIAKYSGIINSHKEYYAKDIDALLSSIEDVNDEYDMDEEPNKENKESLKSRTKEKLAKVSDTLYNKRMVILGVCGTVALCAGIIIAARSFSKYNENSKNNEEDIDNKTTIEQTYEEANKEIINDLKNKGYNEYVAMLMAKNFSNDTIEALKTNPYIEAVENYATVSEFNIDYIMDYENARTIYNLTSDKAVDYVNRSAKIQETGFYNDATINEIVAVVKAIDDQNIIIAENGQLENSIRETLSEIYNNYQFTANSSEEDVKKLEAFKYFAKEDSDLDRFLTKFATLTQNVLNSKNDNKKSNAAKQEIYIYLDTFANTFAGNSYDIENPDEDAIVTDTYNWNMSYHSFIRPLMSMFITEDNAFDWECLSINMVSNYEQWALVNVCTIEQESRTLGGKQ